VVETEGPYRVGPIADPLTDRITAFVRAIGIGVETATVAQLTPCAGILVRRGVIYVDEARLAWPGDLLHEAGHIAVCEPSVRHSLDAIGDDPALIESFKRDGAPGTPMLAWLGMTLGAKAAAAQGAPPFPHMLR
jgi:hypothetical protein